MPVVVINVAIAYLAIEMIEKYIHKLFELVDDEGLVNYEYIDDNNTTIIDR